MRRNSKPPSKGMETEARRGTLGTSRVASVEPSWHRVTPSAADAAMSVGLFGPDALRVDGLARPVPFDDPVALQLQVAPRGLPRALVQFFYGDLLCSWERLLGASALHVGCSRFRGAQGIKGRLRETSTTAHAVVGVWRGRRSLRLHGFTCEHTCPGDPRERSRAGGRRSWLASSGMWCEMVLQGARRKASRLVG